jgi:hypothetical protein
LASRDVNLGENHPHSPVNLEKKIGDRCLLTKCIEKLYFIFWFTNNKERIYCKIKNVVQEFWKSCW